MSVLALVTSGRLSTHRSGRGGKNGKRRTEKGVLTPTVGRAWSKGKKQQQQQQQMRGPSLPDRARSIPESLRQPWLCLHHHRRYVYRHQLHKGSNSLMQVVSHWQAVRIDGATGRRDRGEKMEIYTRLDREDLILRGTSLRVIWIGTDAGGDSRRARAVCCCCIKGRWRDRKR